MKNKDREGENYLERIANPVMRFGSYLFLASVLLLNTACSNDDDDDDNNGQVQPQQVAPDADFVKKAGYSNRAEIELGQLASLKAQDDSVKKFGQLMVTEHTLAQNELKTVGLAQNMAVPDTLDNLHKQLKMQLMMLTGHEFDLVYINSQVIDHQNAKQDFQNEMSLGQNQAVKNYANKYFPNIQNHLTKATGIADLINKK
jgi:putative membrane protein